MQNGGQKAQEKKKVGNDSNKRSVEDGKENLEKRLGKCCGFTILV